MVDLTERLLNYGAKYSQIDPEYLMCIEATAEIERLRAVLIKIQHEAWTKADLETKDCKEPEMIWQSVARRALERIISDSMRRDASTADRYNDGGAAVDETSRNAQ